LPQEEKKYLFFINFISHADVITYITMSIAIHVRTRKKYHSSAKKITQFKFSFFQENIFCKDNRYLLKEKR